MVNTKQIGNLGEAAALHKLVQLGIPTYVQFGDNEAADYLIILDNKVFKLQIKASSIVKEGKIVFSTNHSTLHRKNGKRKCYSVDEVDAFICYNVLNEELYIIKNTGNYLTITFRLEAPKNNQNKNINLASNYLLTLDNLKRELS